MVPVRNGARKAALALVPAVAVAAVLVELLLKASSAPAPRGEAVAAVLFALAAGAAAGLALAAVAALAGAFRRPLRGAAFHVALPLAALGGLAAWELQWGVPTSFAGQSVRAGLALCFALVLLGLLAWVVQRLPAPVRSTRAWLALDAVLVAGLLAFALTRGSGVARPDPAVARAAAGRASVLLVTIDTLRADRVGAYGHAAARTPAFDALAREGWLFESAMTHSFFTGPAHATILGGVTPVRHGVIDNLRRLPAEVTLIPQLLARAGYDTGAFVSGFPVKQRAAGLLERFHAYDDDFRTFRVLPELAYQLVLGRVVQRALEARGHDFDPWGRPSEQAAAAAEAWLAREREGPFFAWAHLYDPHLPYEPPRRLLSQEALDYEGPGARGIWYELDAAEREAILASPRALGHMAELYDAEAAYADEQLARVVAAARRRAGSAGLWIVVTSDHGESFGEHGIYFWRGLYEDTLRVPLVVVPPRPLEAGRRVDEPVRLVDLAPTLLDLLQVESGEEMEGRSLRPLLEALPHGPPPPGLAAILPPRQESYHRVVVAVRKERWKAIWSAPGWAANYAYARWEDERRELYDLSQDPLELVNLAAREGERWRELWTEIQALEQDVQAAQPIGDGEDLRILRSLGYAQ